MKKYITLIWLFTIQFSFGQNKSVSKIVDNLEIQEDTILTIYDWVTDNIKYDVRKLKKLENGVNFYKEGNYKSTEAYLADLLNKVIKKKKGVCDDYTLLFDAMVKELGYESFIVTGITKRSDGKINKNIGHSWNAVKVGNEWRLYDPTWGAGYIKDNKKYVKNYNAKWCNRNPELMKETHFPYDPIWQLSNSPINFKEFKDGKQSNTETLYDFEDLISQHLQKENKEQITDELSRMEASGGNVKAIKNRAKYLKGQTNNHTVPNIIEKSNASSALFSEYFKKGKNKQFKGELWTMKYSESILLEIQDQSKQSIATLKEIETTDSDNKRSLKKLISMCKRLIKETGKEIKFLRSKM